jgi:pilus assembly protein CpaB
MGFSIGQTAQEGEGGEGTNQPEPTPSVPMVEVIGAQIDIPADTVITDTETLLQRIAITEDEFDARGNEYIRNIADVRGQLTLVRVPAESPILRSDLAEPGLSQRIPESDDFFEARPKAYPLQVNSLSGVADQVVEGDEVDIIMTYAIERYVEVDENRIETRTFFTTKTLIQRAEVLRIIRPGRPATDEEGEGGPEPGSDVSPEGEPQVDESGRPIQTGPGAGGATLTAGNWVLILALTNQEIEVLEYTRRVDSRITLALRGRNDEDIEDTLGATISLLYSEFDLPVPGPTGPLFP